MPVGVPYAVSLDTALFPTAATLVQRPLECMMSDEIMGWRKVLVFLGQEKPTFPSFLLSGPASNGVCREVGPCTNAPVLKAQGGGGGTTGDTGTHVSKTAGKISLRSHLGVFGS